MLGSVGGDVVIGASIVILVAIIAFPISPMMALSFEVGLLAGIMLHSAHSCDVLDRNCVSIENDCE